MDLTSSMEQNVNLLSEVIKICNATIVRISKVPADHSTLYEKWNGAFTCVMLGANTIAMFPAFILFSSSSSTTSDINSTTHLRRDA
jgi:hypothetical protein